MAEAPRRTPAVWLATGLGVGLVSPTPGTVGALWGVPIFLAVSQLPSLGLQWVAMLALVALGVPICTRAGRDLGAGKDPQAIVWDEFTTVPIVLAVAPRGLPSVDTIAWLAAGFALHRIFDISKPFPCRRLELLPEGWGVMADDVMAAAYAAVVLATLAAMCPVV
ncbi:Phosphatidylglycerophosphatase A [Pseudobythopirellula maris]|uniref:Phosphatidylglycerophosphatase A n=1 Tax=Pseudobythopirellula maris TaxID=2527991 RepID=A0A5C5ZQJ7_9BACT|nr:phosphatidylglycerophosphatase A [Pseudobythopirellula maris]TWT88563.1 Phosphatidylglycerophosphatase A [Pseudobythopirellula maris]